MEVDSYQKFEVLLRNEYKKKASKVDWTDN